MNKKVKLPKPIRVILGYNIRPINGGQKWGIYAGKKFKAEKASLAECEVWCQLAYDTSTKVNRIKKIEAANALKPEKEKTFTGFMKKSVAKKETKLAIPKTKKKAK